MKVKRTCGGCKGSGHVELVSATMTFSGECYLCHGSGKVEISLEEATEEELADAYEGHHTACGLIAAEQAKRPGPQWLEDVKHDGE